MLKQGLSIFWRGLVSRKILLKICQNEDFEDYGFVDYSMDLQNSLFQEFLNAIEENDSSLIEKNK